MHFNTAHENHFQCLIFGLMLMPCVLLLLLRATCHPPNRPDLSRRLLVGGGLLTALVSVPTVVSAAEAETADDSEARIGKVRSCSTSCDRHHNLLPHSSGTSCLICDLRVCVSILFLSFRSNLSP